MDLSPDQKRQLRVLMDAFLEENAKINLSAYRTEDSCWVGNILDSILCFDTLLALRLRSAPLRMTSFSIELGQHDIIKIIDVGTGGGFPLLPLAILFPDTEFTGLDATRKKVDAVQRIVEKLQIPNVKLILGRAEELGHDDLLREKFDVVLSRALAPLATLLELMSPFSRIGGRLLCWKSMSIEEELAASSRSAKQMQCDLIEQEKYDLPGDWGSRQILIYEKIAALPWEFPRDVGVPKKDPL